MKLHITKEQCMELSETQAVRLLDWYLDSFEKLYDDTVVHEYLPEEDMIHHGNFDEEREFEKANYMGKIKNYEGDIRPILNIGQMIMFLGATGPGSIFTMERREHISFIQMNDSTTFRHENFCDALWAACKEKLNHNER